MAYTDILYEKKDGVAWITINRPEVRNAFRTRTVRELTEAFEDAKFDRPSASSSSPGRVTRPSAPAATRRSAGRGATPSTSGPWTWTPSTTPSGASPSP